MTSPETAASDTGVAASRRERSRVAALSAAWQILVQEGWEALTQQHVAEVAGIGRATVYRHWPDRTSLLQDVLSAEVVTLHTVMTGDVRADLLAELRSMRDELCKRHFDRVLVTLVDRAFVEPDMLAVKAAMVHDGTANLRQILEHAARLGELRPELDLDEAVSFLVAPVVYRHLFADDDVTDEMLRRVVEDFLSLRRTAPTTSSCGERPHPR